MAGPENTEQSAEEIKDKAENPTGLLNKFDVIAQAWGAQEKYTPSDNARGQLPRNPDGSIDLGTACQDYFNQPGHQLWRECNVTFRDPQLSRPEQVHLMIPGNIPPGQHFKGFIPRSDAQSDPPSQEVSDRAQALCKQFNPEQLAANYETLVRSDPANKAAIDFIMHNYDYVDGQMQKAPNGQLQFKGSITHVIDTRDDHGMYNPYHPYKALKQSGTVPLGTREELNTGSQDS